MIRKILKVALLVCIAWTTTGCDAKPERDVSDLPTALNDTPSIPEHWAQISLAKEKVGDNLRVTLKGKKKTFKDIVEQISNELSKPIRFSPDVDQDQSLEEFEFKMDNGSWKDLLSAIAAKFSCAVKESDSGFFVTPNE